MNFINKKLVHSVLGSSINESRIRINQLCDYDLLAAAQLEHRLPVYRSLLTEAKRRGLIEPAQKQKTKPAHQGQTSLAL